MNDAENTINWLRSIKEIWKKEKTKRTRILRVKKEEAEILVIHNEKRGCGEFNTHRTYRRKKSEAAGHLTDESGWTGGQRMGGTKKISVTKSYKGWQGLQSSDRRHSEWTWHIEPDDDFHKTMN